MTEFAITIKNGDYIEINDRDEKTNFDLNEDRTQTANVNDFSPDKADTL